jgi:hypothetical protein
MSIWDTLEAALEVQNNTLDIDFVWSPTRSTTAPGGPQVGMLRV